MPPRPAWFAPWRDTRLRSRTEPSWLGCSVGGVWVFSKSTTNLYASFHFPGTGIKWAGGSPTTLMSSAGAIDVVTFNSIVPGSFFGFEAGQVLAGGALSDAREGHDGRPG